MYAYSDWRLPRDKVNCPGVEVSYGQGEVHDICLNVVMSARGDEKAPSPQLGVGAKLLRSLQVRPVSVDKDALALGSDPSLSCAHSTRFVAGPAERCLFGTPRSGLANHSRPLTGLREGNYDDLNRVAVAGEFCGMRSSVGQSTPRVVRSQVEGSTTVWAAVRRLYIVHTTHDATMHH